MLIKKAVYMYVSTGRPNSNVDASYPKGISLHVAAPSRRQRKNGERELPLSVFPSSGGGCRYTKATKAFPN